MKKQEILDILQLTELPAAGQPGKSKCAALVQRTTGQQDYVITKGGGIITDIGYKCAVVKIVEYYPVVKVAPVPVAVEEKPIPQQEPVLTQTHIEEQKPQVKHTEKDKFNRFTTIAFLEKKNMSKEKLLRKTDKQLQELMEGFR